MSEAAPVLYDTVELRRRIAGAFSAGELRALADSLGVGGINWDRGLQEAAREVVRQCERYAGLPSLVARLREERPLVEWPEPLAAAPAAPPDAPPPPAAPIPPTRAYPALPTLASSPGTFGPPAILEGARERPPTQPAGAPTVPGAPFADPYAPPPGPPALTGAPFADPYAAPPGPPAVQIPVVAAPPPAPPRTAGWPGVVGEPAPAARPGGVDPRIFIAVAGLMVVAAVIAYLAGRASSATADTEGSAAASASAPAASARAVRSDGPTALAADAFSRSFANLARVCELPSSAGTGVQVFRRVFERCGPPPPPPQRRPFTPATPSATSSADPAPPPSADPAPPRNRRPNPAPGDPPVQAKGGCMGGCDARHTSCQAHCGPEPNESGAYDSYQRCQGQCLRDASRCRLSCR